MNSLLTRYAVSTFLSCCLTLLGLHGTALGQSDVERAAAAQSLYDKASTLLEEKKYAEACPKLEEVTRLVPEALGAKLALAECYEAINKLSSAWTLYAAVEAGAARTGQ